MTQRIPQSIIQDIIAGSDIIEIIQSRIQLTKQGRNFTARCPFHEEKTPSFSVNSSKQFYYCFGCSASGNVVSFLMNYDHLSFREAIEFLAIKQGIDVQSTHDPKHDINNSSYDLLEKVTRYYCKVLRKSQIAIDYLKSRHLSVLGLALHPIIGKI